MTKVIRIRHGTPISNNMFYRNSRTEFRDFTDGLSNTLFPGEHTNGPIPGGTLTAGHSYFE